MGKVLVLPDHIASQIAAGEVVERPSSVVKELVENALDAGATQIEVSVNSDCRDIRVADNGCGMTAEDAVLAFQRHATSKIRSADDLWQLQSLGFRGEALPSIASIAHVSCYTRMHDTANGARIDCAEGKITCKETGCAPGSVMEITDLFYNVPARLSFLKKASTEFAHIQEIVQSLAVAYPHASIHLLNSGNTALRTTGSGDLAQAAREAGLLTGREELCIVDYEDARSSVRLKGVAARPIHFRGDRKGILSIVNKRPVRCHLTYKALEYAYSDLIPRGRHPLAIVALEIDCDKVDVNIHPTKKEIKYSNGNDVYLSIQRALVNALRQVRTEYREQLEQRAQFEQREQFEESIAERALSGSAHFAAEPPILAAGYGVHPPETPSRVNESEDAEYVRNRQAVERAIEQISFRDKLDYVPPPPPAVRRGEPANIGSMHGLEPIPASEPVAPEESHSLPADWRIAGYIHNTYILIESADGLVVVEQHIAHERTLYERILGAQELPGRICEHSQRLVICAPLDLSAEQSATLRTHAVVLQRLGFDFDFQSDDTVLCTQVPLELAHKNYAQIVQSMVCDLSTTDNADLELEATKSIACQAAIKNGMPLSESDIIKLLSDWLRTPRNDTCPHGRPIMLRFTKEKLFELFHPV